MDPSSSSPTPCSCHGCGLYILDKYVMSVNGHFWHATCVKCTDCHQQLDEKCYSKNYLLYCRKDYFRRFGPECRGCKEKLLAEHVVRRVQDLIFHESCLQCSFCNRKVITGDRIYRTDESKILCEEDYLKINKGSGSCSVSPNSQTIRGEGPSDRSQSSVTPTAVEASEERNKTPFPFNMHFMEDRTNSGAVESVICNSIDGESDYSTGLENAHRNARRKVTSDAPPKNNMADHETTAVTGSSVYDEGGEADESVSSEPGVEVPCRLDQEDIVNSHASTGKKRGPRTTIKAKQLDMLKAAFIATPKPTRHIREQLSKDTGLSMRVIQVWFQNRRSKERRVKQVNLYGSRRHLYSRLPQRHLQNGFVVRQSDCQAPNINIMEPGMGRINMFQYDDSSISDGEASRIKFPTPYYNSNDADSIDNKFTHESLGVVAPIFHDSNNMCHDTVSMPFGVDTAPDYVADRPFIQELSCQESIQGYHEHDIPRFYTQSLGSQVEPVYPLHP